MENRPPEDRQGRYPWGKGAPPEAIASTVVTKICNRISQINEFLFHCILLIR
jgi:hypothetical protein